MKEASITVLGPNGAGKITLFNTIAGTLEPSQGTISLKIQLITRRKTSCFLSHVFSRSKDGDCPRMTVAENLLLAQNRR